MELPSPIPFAGRQLRFRATGESEIVSDDRSNTSSTADGTVVWDPATDAVIGGAATQAQSSSHRGERHLDGDELLYVTDGAMRVWFETDEGRREVAMFAGEALLVPANVWHGLIVEGTCSLVWLGGGRTEIRQA